MTIRRAIIVALMVLAAMSVPLQMVIDGSAANVAACCIVLASSLSILSYISWTRALDTQPLSTFALFGFCVTTQLGALLVQTATWTALRSSLYDPLYTFGTLAFYQSIALLVHIIYRYFSSSTPTGIHLFRSLLEWGGLYRTPSCASLWIMGFIGLINVFLSRYTGVVGKIAIPFVFLTWAPFLIPFYARQLGGAYCNERINRFLLVGYALAVALLGVGLNTRGIMFAGIVTVGLLYLLSGMRSEAPVSSSGLLKVAAVAAVLVAASVPVSNLATSMAIARQARGKVSPTEMIRTTLRVYRNPGLIDAYRAGTAAASRYKPYDEHYFDNPLISRFVETKFHDNAFHFARALKSEEAKTRLRDVSIQFAWAGLPTPVLARLGIGVNKDQLAYSMGDYLAYLSRGIPLGGRKIGSMFAQGIVVFGPFFPFVYAVICLAMFGLMDLLTLRPKEGVVTVTALGMLQILNFFLGGLSYDGLHQALYFIVRNFETMVVIYLLIAAFSRMLIRMRLVFRTQSVSIAVPARPVW